MINFVKEESSARLLFYSALVLFFVLHLYRLNAPPNGYHQWRESDTAAIAMNYYQEDMTFLQPRVNQRGAGSGVTGSELPIYNYSVALVYQLVGPHHAVARLLTLLAACLGLWFFYRLTRRVLSQTAASLSVWALAFSPLFFFYSYKIMPDIWMLSLGLGSVLFYLRFLDDKKLRHWLLSVLLLVLAAGIKPLILSIYLPFLYVTWRNRSSRRNHLWWWAAYVAATLLPVLGWFWRARQLKAEGGHVFYLGEALLDFTDYFLQPQFFKKLFLQWPWELWIGWILVPAFVWGLYRAAGARIGGLFMVWIIAAFIVFILTASHACTHDYYTLIIPAPLAGLTGYGLSLLLRESGWRRLTAIVLIALAPISTVARIYHRFGPTDEYHAIRRNVDRVIPRQARVIVQGKTPPIRLYQLNRHGWRIETIGGYDNIASMVRQGAEFLILDQPFDPNSDSLRLIFEPSAVRLGPLYCYRVLPEAGT